MEKQEFESQIASLDLKLFEKIESKTSFDDKKSLLDIQNSVRSLEDSYVYLEIGSHLGGSIQPHLLDHKCHKIFSIDKRPLVQPDERWSEGYEYPDNSTQRMLHNLKRLTADLSKIICFDSDAADIDKNRIIPKPDICFIDGEHTNLKVFSDFKFCKSILNKDGVIVFHDAGVVARGIDRIIEELKKNKENFKAYYLPSAILVLDFSKSEMIFKTLRSSNIAIYTPPSFWLSFKRAIPTRIKNKIKLLLKLLKLSG